MKKIGRNVCDLQQTPIFAPLIYGSVAQLDRASDYGSEGLGFESLRDHINKKGLHNVKSFLLCLQAFTRFLFAKFISIYNVF